MGWSIYAVLIKSDKQISYEKFIDELGYDVVRYLPEEPLNNVLYAEEDKIFFGSYKGITIIASYKLPFALYNNANSKEENKLAEFFPDTEIAAVSLQSTVNHFGFALLKNGRKIRIKAGDAIAGTAIDLGEPLKEELELLAKSRRDSKGKRTYFIDSISGGQEEFAEHQVGENFVFQIFTRFTGMPLDEDDDLLDIPMIGYEIAERISPVEDYFTGEWRGSYMYGADYPERSRGRVEMFTIAGNLAGYGRITGDCIDDSLKGDEPAKIDGFINGIFIGFTKKYPYLLFTNEEGKSVKHKSAKSSTIAYSGLYNPQTDSFFGIWQIEKTNLKGTWQMTRE